MEICKINVIGSGNVAAVLANHLKDVVDIESIYSKNITHALDLANRVGAMGINDIKKLSKSVDLNIVAIKDDAIAKVVKNMDKSIPIVHTSGSVPIRVLNDFQIYGIFYPLQTFSKSVTVTLSEVPFLIEGNSSEFEQNLMAFCQSNISKKCVIADSDLRQKIHLSAVMTNNFMTALMVEAETILKENNLSLDILKPLLYQTLDKAFSIGPKNAQTGPAKRNDNQIIQQQINALKSQKLKDIYQLLSDLIKEQQS